MVNWPCRACGMHYNIYLTTEVASAITGVPNSQFEVRGVVLHIFKNGINK